MRGALATFFGLVFLHAAVSSKASAQRAGGFFTGAAGVLSRLVDPTIPLIPQKGSATATTSSSSGPVAVAPVTSTTTAPTFVPVGASPQRGSGLTNFA